MVPKKVHLQQGLLNGSTFHGASLVVVLISVSRYTIFQPARQPVSQTGWLAGWDDRPKSWYASNARTRRQELAMLEGPLEVPPLLADCEIGFQQILARQSY